MPLSLHGIPYPLVCLPQGRYTEQMLDQYHFHQHDGAGAVEPAVVAIVRTEQLVQPLVVHHPLYFSQQMLFRHQRVYVCYYSFSP